MTEHLYIVAYDIAAPRRWRKVFRTLSAYGDWVQLSVFQCRMSRMRHAELIALLDGIILHEQDHVLIMDVGVTNDVAPHIVSLGKAFNVVDRAPVII
jgi:CRISPR-associated endoribonuclease Cas2